MRLEWIALCAVASLLGCDARTSIADAGADAGAADGGASDAGAPDAGLDCPAEIVDPYPGRPCSADTRTCTETCTGEGCAGECIDADPNPQCYFCFQVNVVSCFNRNGCQPVWNCFRECMRAHCAGAPDTEACALENCAEQDAAFGACIDSLWDSTSCPARYEDCLPEG